MTTYHVYVDWTTDDHRQPYYVGKGTSDRVNDEWRGPEHYEFSQKRGRERIVVLSTDDEAKALDKELELTLALRTHEFGFNKVVGANGVRQQHMRRRVIHVKLDEDVHVGLKQLAVEQRTTMQGILERHAIELVRGRQPRETKPLTKRVRHAKPDKQEDRKRSGLGLSIETLRAMVEK